MTDEIIAATGHRPEKLGGYGAEIQRDLKHLAKRYFLVHRPKQVITGMALGWDQAIALACIQLHIPFIAALPFEGQEQRWSTEQRGLYFSILMHASEIVTVASGGYSTFKYQARNKWMADHCTRLVALWDGSAGGTANMIRYAQGPGRWRTTDNLWELYKGEYLDRRFLRDRGRDANGRQ